jgi:hypothetical protein
MYHMASSGTIYGLWSMVYGGCTVLAGIGDVCFLLLLLLLLLLPLIIRLTFSRLLL